VKKKKARVVTRFESVRYDGKECREHTNRMLFIADSVRLLRRKRFVVSREGSRLLVTAAAIFRKRLFAALEIRDAAIRKGNPVVRSTVRARASTSVKFDDQIPSSVPALDRHSLIRDGQTLARPEQARFDGYRTRPRRAV